MVPSFTAGCRARADDANRPAPLSIRDRKQTAVLRKAQEHEPRFATRVTRIGHDAAQWIAENRGCLLKRDFVLGEICRGFPRIPLELQHRTSLYLPLPRHVAPKRVYPQQSAC